jgi:hypothetical protein
MQEIKYPRQDPKTGKMRGEYYSWHNMISRINLPEKTAKKKENKVYANKRLELYEPWRQFDNFFEDMGEKPSAEYSLDRIDNSKGYYPENCRWASPTEQIRNRDCTRTITANGKTQTWTEWAEELETTYEAVRGRWRKGWSDEDIVNVKYKHRSFNSNQKIYSEETKERVVSLIKQGKSQKQIYKEMDISGVGIAKIVKEARQNGKLPPFKQIA